MWQLLITATLMTSPSADLASYTTWSSPDEQVEQLARDFRITTYDNFRTERPEYNRRRAAGNTVENAWYASGRNPARRQQVLDWFQHATEAGPQDPLPTLPEFVHTVSFEKPAAEPARPAIRSTSTGPGNRAPAPPQLSAEPTQVDTTLHVTIPEQATSHASTKPRHAATAGEVESFVEQEAKEATGVFGSLGRALWHGAMKSSPAAGNADLKLAAPKK